jgi:hypothetical protein
MRIGIAVASDAVRALLVRGDSIIWTDELVRESETDLSETIVSLLVKAPFRRWPRPAVAAAIGPHASQVKLLAALPPVDDPEIIAAIVHERPSAYFLSDAGELRTTSARVVGPGIAWVGAVPAAYVDAVRRGCRAVGLRLTMIAPSATVLPRVTPDRRLQITDGPISLHITVSDAGLESARRLPTSLADPTGRIAVIGPLETLGDRAVYFADAFGVTMIGPGAPITLGPHGELLRANRRLATSLSIPALIAVLVAAILLLSPLASLVAARRMEVELGRIESSEAWQLAEEAIEQLRDVSSSLAAIEEFTVLGRGRLHLLASLAGAMPDSTAIQNLDMHDERISVVAVAPNASLLLAALGAVPGITSTELDTDEAHITPDGRQLRSIAIKFRYSDSDIAAPTAEQ